MVPVTNEPTGLPTLQPSLKNVIAWECILQYWSFVRGIHWSFPSQRVGNVEFWCFLYCWPEQAVEQTVDGLRHRDVHVPFWCKHYKTTSWCAKPVQFWTKPILPFENDARWYFYWRTSICSTKYRSENKFVQQMLFISFLTIFYGCIDSPSHCAKFIEQTFTFTPWQNYNMDVQIHMSLVSHKIYSRNTVKPVYNDHLMGYISAFWSSSRWPRAT